ncbi:MULTISPECIES: IclR family transcriptional regulator [Rhodococcoides]|uniref:IclR family transcriptional regulator n=1 Tax=Rhodococcoides corynebacterioides TaxID=53972 RepID=A0ABS7NYJ5_9NOCA|nr:MULTISPECIES: IclR family transcriptional regulator [Rhodococcus]MBT1191230.1 IclR family transcriptional regulator [Rhodococcus kroppenstedtii]MBY6348965.1 IclR family transcriptional regulator [Rhodococcus corynebacterioides]MBY6361647.1 IclR family transcriptional regulator [Rhodococcus corynebacterioides]MBY6365218.1 IclR family transcriptional regulator [Rhodococcus corynebacterioides]MBY6406630.1 IclR family transcriptional regulator [Rhodococcus corynebacterioides]
MSAPASNMRSLDRAFDVLTVLQSTKHPLRLAEVARSSELHIATAQRILGVLVHRGYAARTADGYTAGPAALAVAHAFMVTNPLSVLAQPIMQQLASSTGFTASLYVRVEHSRVLIARVESENPLSYVLPVGERLPLHLGGAGKMFLAGLPPEEVDSVLADVAGATVAGGGALDVDLLRRQLEVIARDDYAVSVGERLVGIASVTAPVRARGSDVVAVLGVTGSSDRLNGDAVSSVVAEVRRAATTLGDRIPPAG